MDTPAPTQTQIPLTEVRVSNENEALNVLISFINVAHKRGAYSIDESAKIWECIKFFMVPNDRQQQQPVEVQEQPASE